MNDPKGIKAPYQIKKEDDLSATLDKSSLTACRTGNKSKIQGLKDDSKNDSYFTKPSRENNKESNRYNSKNNSSIYDSNYSSVINLLFFIFFRLLLLLIFLK